MYGVVKFDSQNYIWTDLMHTIFNIYGQQNEPQDGDQSQRNPDFIFGLNKELAPFSERLITTYKIVRYHKQQYRNINRSSKTSEH
jgi:hypothetical protein